VVVGGDTNNGYARREMPLAWCPHHQRAPEFLTKLQKRIPIGIFMDAGANSCIGNSFFTFPIKVIF